MAKAQITVRNPNKLAADQVREKDVAARVATGDPAANITKTDGIKIRGTGAATKGIRARGPMG